MPAPKGNKNRVIAPEQRKRGKNMNISMPYEEWEAFKAAADLSEGAARSEDAYMDLWRGLCRSAVSQFIKAHHGLLDPSVPVD